MAERHGLGREVWYHTSPAPCTSSGISQYTQLARYIRSAAHRHHPNPCGSREIRGFVGVREWDSRNPF
eukprot:scaffold20544_cov158-Amphora_coffeaeformis.AAC.1